MLVLDLQKNVSLEKQWRFSFYEMKSIKKRTSVNLTSSTPSRLIHLIKEASITRSWKLRSRRYAAVGLFCKICTTSLTCGAFTVPLVGITSSTARLKYERKKEVVNTIGHGVNHGYRTQERKRREGNILMIIKLTDRYPTPSWHHLWSY